MSYVCVIKHFDMLKTELFNSELQNLAELAKVLSHPARLAILKHLAECKTCISGDITDAIPLSRTTVSQHLQELKKSGFIQGEIEGVKIHYCLDNEKIKNISEIIDDFFKSIECCKNDEC